MSCMTILFPNLQITKSDNRPHTKLAVSIVGLIAYGHFNLCAGMYGLTYIFTLSSMRVVEGYVTGECCYYYELYILDL